jgi:hypothetical protein
MLSPPYAPPGFMEAREAHYTKFFGPIKSVFHSNDFKPVHVDVYLFSRNEQRSHYTLITGGMSDARMVVPQEGYDYVTGYSEILLYASSVENWMVSVLKSLAEMPLEDKTYLHWMHTVPNGQPMTAKPSLLTSFLFLPAYFEDKAFSYELFVGGNQVQPLMLVPITEAEREFAVENGSEALAERFEEVGLDPVVDEQRKSVV